MLREEQRAMPAYEEPPVLPGGSFLIRETTGYAGGGTPQKSFSFKHRAKRVTNKTFSTMEASLEYNRPFTGCGASDASGIISVPLKRPAGSRPL